MAQDQIKKDEKLDLVAEIQRVAATADFDDPTPKPPPTVTVTKRPPPPLPFDPASGSAVETGPGMQGPDEPHDVGKPAFGTKLPPALPLTLPAQGADAGQPDAPPAARGPARKPELPPDAADQAQGQTRKGERRAAKRRAALPSRDQIAANDDAPSIGGLIYALNQKPSRQPFALATTGSAVWAVITLAFASYFWANEIIAGAGLRAFLGRPELLTLIATLVGPIGLMFALAVIAYRAEEMRLRSSAMTEVAVRLAEPDRMAEQSVASLGQAVRRQVSFMNDAVSRALGRAGELEALVHNEVTALENSYSENERRIRRLIEELVDERNALVDTSDKVSGTLKAIGGEVPELIEKLSSQQIKLAKIIEGASINLTSLESAIATQAGNLETVVGERTDKLQVVLGDYTTALSSSLDQRMEQIGSTIASRTSDLQLVFEEYTRALDSTLSNRAQALDIHLVERTQAIDQAFAERLRMFDEALLRSTVAIDQSVSEKALALTSALDRHAHSLGETLSRQSLDLDESLLQGINAVRRTSENITRQSIKALEGLAGQSELLKNVSENLLGQINTITNRFDSQSQQIVRAANSLETANYKIDMTLQNRNAELSATLDRLSGKADELGHAAQGYTRQIEGTIGEVEHRARSLTAEIAQTAEERSRATLADIERLKSTATDTTTRALDDLRNRFAHVSQEVTQGINALTQQFTETSGDARRRAAEATAELAAEQERLRLQAQGLPGATRESADAMRRVLQDHVRAIDQLSSLSRRESGARDVNRPMEPARQLVPFASQPYEQNRAMASLTATLSQELQSRARPSGGHYGASDGREGWSLGDLLKRASADDDGAHHAGLAHATPGAPPRRGGLDIAAVARAIDPATAAAIWQRLGAGQRGIMVRSIYAAEGRLLFDETVERLRADPEFAQTAHQYLMDFERVLQEADRQDHTGQSAQGHLRSDYGRVYLFLAHATGRIT